MELSTLDHAWLYCYHAGVFEVGIDQVFVFA